jgi:hypothetical protein
VSLSRKIERAKMEKAVEEKLKEYGASRNEAQRDLMSLGIKPTLKNMYDYLVGRREEQDD